MKTVRVRLAGGLGNQLFQYHAGFLLAKTTNRNLVLDDQLIKFEKAYKTRMAQGFKQVGIRGLLGQENFSTSFLLNESENLYRAKDKFLELIGALESRNFFGDDTGSDLNVRKFKVESTAKNILLQGNLQSSEIAIEAKKLGSLESFRNYNFGETHREQPIILHVRLSDYRVPNASKYMVGPDYYENALRNLNHDFPESPIWLFSDEPKVALNYIPKKYRDRVTFTNNPNNLTDVQELELMSKGIAYINTNSTFSFWASFLSNGKKIIAPTPWFKGSDKNEKITLFKYPENWSELKW